MKTLEQIAHEFSIPAEMLPALRAAQLAAFERVQWLLANYSLTKAQTLGEVGTCDNLAALITNIQNELD